MSVVQRLHLTHLIGTPFEELTLPQRAALLGKWIALEVYTPETLPLRRVEAVGYSAADCAGQLRARGLDPQKFEFRLMSTPW